MITLINEIQADIDWRISQLSTIKTLPTKYGMREKHINSLIWYSVPSIYALWEGFIKNTFKSYGSFISKKNLAVYDIDVNILTYAIDNECQLRNERINVTKQKEFVKKIFKIFTSPLNINIQELTGSNLKYKETNLILERFNLEKLDYKYKIPLNRLIHFRNHIAHGDNSIIVKKSDVEQFSLLVVDIMYEILLKIEYSCNEEKYLFSTP